MPLGKEFKRRSDVTDSGCETLDSVSSNTTPCQDRENENRDEDENQTQDEWLESLGVENSEIRRINSSQVIVKYTEAC